MNNRSKIIRLVQKQEREAAKSVALVVKDFRWIVRPHKMILYNLHNKSKDI
jgi:hypothetical protein